MFVHYRTQGVILKKEDRGEADQLFTIYTKDFGKLEILGKAIRKITSKLRSGADIFYFSEIEFIQGKNQKTLTDAILINKFKNISTNLGKFETADKISEVLNELIKRNEPDERIWHLLIESFNRLNASYELQVISFKIYYYFFWNFLRYLGYQPELYNCSICDRKLSPGKIYFYPKSGGTICRNCVRGDRDKIKEISINAIKILRIIFERDWFFFNKIKINQRLQKELGAISEYYFLYLKRFVS